MPNHEEYVRQACIEALKSNMSSKHGCIIRKRDKIIARGHNKLLIKYGQFNSRTKNIRSVHAEIDALSNTDKRYLKNTTLYVVRIKPACDEHKIMTSQLKEILCNSEPCKNCNRIIHKKFNCYKLNILYSH